MSHETGTRCIEYTIPFPFENSKDFNGGTDECRVDVPFVAVALFFGHVQNYFNFKLLADHYYVENFTS